MADNEKIDMTVGINVESDASKTTKDIEQLSQQLDVLSKGYKKVSDGTTILDDKSEKFLKQIEEISKEIHKLSSEAGNYLKILNSSGDKVSKSTFKTDKHGNHSYSYNSKDPTESVNANKVISSHLL